jgi:hypothetical protein
MPYQSTGCCYTHLPVDVMTNGFNISDWNHNHNSDLSLFIIADDSIDLIKDYYDIMTDRLRRQILEASPCARIQREVGIIEKVERYQRLSSYNNGDCGSLVVAVATWQHWWWWWQQRGVSGGGGSLGLTQWWRGQHDYKTEDEAELMEENFGNKEEDDDTLGG